MKGIYLTEEGKAEIQAKIADLESGLKVLSLTEGFKDMGKISIYKEILSSATILPVEESFYTVENMLNRHCGRTGCSKDDAILKEYLNGVIIQPKQ
jgi:hypothetical protein